MAVGRSQPGVALALGCLLFVAFAGCVGEEADTPDAARDDGSGSKEPGPALTNTTPDTGGRALEVETETALFAPDWKIGHTWTYLVAGRLYPYGYEATVGVIGVRTDHYLMGTPTKDELQNFMVFDSMFLGNVQKDTLSILHGGDYQDVVGFSRSPDAEWTLTAFNQDFTVKKNGTGTVEALEGPSRGVVVEGVAEDEDRIRIVYAADVGWLMSMQITNKTGTLEIGYDLVGLERGADVSDFTRWEKRGFYVRTANVNLLVVNSAWVDTTWSSDGLSDLLYVRVETPTEGTAMSRLIDPEQQVQVETGPVSEERLNHFEVADQEGSWTIVVVSDASKYVDPTDPPPPPPDPDPEDPRVYTPPRYESRTRLIMTIYQVEQVEP